MVLAHRVEPQRFDVDDSSYLRRRSDAVKARIRRLNPEGLCECCIPRGWHPHDQISLDYLAAVPVRMVIARVGRAAFDRLPRSAFIRRGRRRAVKRERFWQLQRGII